MEHNVKILKIENLTHSVKKFVLEKPKDYLFKEGQSTIISIKKEGFEKKKRTFSLASINDDKNLEFIIKIYYERDGMTKEFDKLKEGDYLLIGNSYGKIEYKGEGIFIAGGSGIVPFLSIFRNLEKEKKINKNFLIYSNKTYEDIINLKEIRDIFGDNVIFILTKEKKKGYHNKRIDLEFLKRIIEKNDKFDSFFYTCGPRALVLDIKEMLMKIGIKKEKIIFEGM